LLHHYENVVRTEVTRLGGSVVHVIGDGIVAGFGHPVANEDDAERAIRALCSTGCWCCGDYAF
jgi:class 3 adenylate cyclase